MYRSGGTDRKSRGRRTECHRTPLIDQVRHVDRPQSGSLIIAGSGLIGCVGSSVLGLAWDRIIANRDIVENACGRWKRRRGRVALSKIFRGRQPVQHIIRLPDTHQLLLNHQGHDSREGRRRRRRSTDADEADIPMRIWDT